MQTQAWHKMKGFFYLESLLEETLAFARQKYQARMLILLKALEKAVESRTQPLLNFFCLRNRSSFE